MIRFFGFVKGWIARTVPELMPEGSLQRCRDLNFSHEGGLRCVRELDEISVTGVSSTGSSVREFFQVTSGSSTIYYTIKSGQLKAKTNNRAWRNLQTQSGNSWAYYTVMTPTPSTQKVVYIATPAGLIRDTGEQKFVSGTTYTDVGCDSPSGMSSVVITQASSLTAGDYKVAYTYYNSTTGAESELSGISTHTVAGSTESLRLTSELASTFTHADYVRGYRSIANGGTLYFDQQMTVVPGAKRSIVFTQADSALGVSHEGTTGQPPKNATILTSWKERLWISGVSYFDGAAATQKVFFSRRGLPETMSPDYYVLIDDSEADIKSLVSYADSLYVITRKDIYEIVGTTADSFRVEPTNSFVGTTAGKSVASSPDGIYFVNNQGVYRFRFKAEKVSEQIDWLFSDSGNQWHTVLSESDIANSRGVYWDDKYWLSVGDRTLIYEPDQKRWRERTTKFTCFWVDVPNNKLYTGFSRPNLATRRWTVGSILDDGTSGISGMYSPEFITKAEYIAGKEFDHRIGQVSKYKFYCKGKWAWHFYTDDVSIRAFGGTTYSPTRSKHQIYNLTTDIIGHSLYVRALSTGNSVQPNHCNFYTMEIW